MNNPTVSIKKCYGFTCAGGAHGHISLTNDGRAVMLLHNDDQLKFQVFTAHPNETAEAHAKRHVWENIDAEADFFEDRFLDLLNWLLHIT